MVYVPCFSRVAIFSRIFGRILCLCKCQYLLQGSCKGWRILEIDTFTVELSPVYVPVKFSEAEVT